MTTQAALWIGGGAAVLVAAIAALADRRRGRRRDIDRVGWVPWTAIQVVAMTLAAVAFGFAVKL